ncbi:UDP-XYL synthase 6, partial [Striga asiatica]
SRANINRIEFFCCFLFPFPLIPSQPCGINRPIQYPLTPTAYDIGNANLPVRHRIEEWEEGAELALRDYNKKHGINLKLERALECNRFECSGLLMDFTKKKTTWVHMNLVASVGPKEELHVLFAEFYLSDVADDEYVLATLAPVDTSWEYCVSKRDGLCCRFCPDDIRHPMKGRFCLLEEDEPLGFD